MATTTIKSGQTLSGIAKSAGTTVSALMAANPSIKDANKIQAGASLNIPSSTSGVSQTTTAPATTSSLPRYDSKGGFTSGGVYYAPDSIQAKNSRTISPASQINPVTPIPNSPYPDLNLSNQGINQALGTYNAYYNADGTPKSDLLAVNTQNTGTVMQDYLTNLLQAESNRPSQAELYNQAQKETGILAKQETVNQAQQQLNAINAQGQAAQLQTVGQGRGIPETIIGGQQAQIARETAIQALPVAAQLSAAQGNLEMANQNLNTLFTIKAADAKQNYDFKVSLLTSLKDYATSQEDKALNFALKQEDRKYQETQALQGEQQNYAKMAFNNNQSTLGSQISKLDYKSPTFKIDLAKLTSQIYDPMLSLDKQIKEAQLNKLKTEIPIGLKPGEVSVPIPLNPVQTQALQSAKDLLAKFDKGVTSAVGKSNIFGSFGYSLIPGTARADFVSQFDNLKSLLSLDNVKLLKGQGAVSDAERKLLADASTKLSRNQSESEFRVTLQNIIDTFNKASPEYQYVNNISSVLDTSGGTLSASQYVNSILNQ